MVSVEPVPDEPAAVTTAGGDRTLLIADYHAGVETALRYERGVEVPSRADDRRERLLGLLDRTRADRLVVLGDLMHSIGDPGGAERGELEVLFESLPSIEVTLVKGNHDGAIESWLGDGNRSSGAPRTTGTRVTASGGTIAADLSILPGEGGRLDGLGVCHGHSWPSPAALDSDVLCMGHEHPCVRLEDEVGGSRVEPAWLRGRLDPAPFRPRPKYDGVGWLDATGNGDSDSENGIDSPALVVLPAFNDLVGGTWVNLPEQSFLAPFLPAGLAEGEAYLLDGTRLGPYRAV